MAALTGAKPKDTYKDLLQVSNSNSGVDTTLRAVSDGEATDSALKISTTGVQIAPGGTADFTFSADLLAALEGSAIVVGHTEALTLINTSTFQVLGTAAEDASMAVGRWSDDTNGARLRLGKSRNAAVGSNTIVQNNDELGSLQFFADDGVDFNTVGATITARIAGTPGGNDMPTELVFSTTADGAASPTERLFLLPNGDLQHNSAYDLTSASGNGVSLTTDGAVIVQRPDTDADGSPVWLGYDGTNPTSEIELNGDFLSDTNSYGTPASDREFKENIKDRPKDLSKVKMLKRKTWRWKGDAPVSRHARTEGFVAQDVQAVFPHLVSQRRDGKLRYNTMGLVYELWDICADLIDRIEAPEA